MGLLGFLGGLAADAAKDYVSKRGIDGIMEDAGNLKSRVSGMFSSNEEYDADEEYETDEENMWDTLDEILEAEDFDGAEEFIQDTFRYEEKDEFFYYAMALIYNKKAITLNTLEDEQKAKSFITNACNMCAANAEWSSSLRNLKKVITENLEIFKEEKSQLDQAENELNELSEMFDLNSNCSGEDAIAALNAYYERFGAEPDMFYYQHLFIGYENILIKSDLDSDLCERYFQDMKDAVNKATDIAKSNPDELKEIAEDLQERMSPWENIYYEGKIEKLISSNNLSQALKLVDNIKNDEESYTRIMTSIESLRLLEMVSNGQPSNSDVRQKISVVEDFMQRACSLQNDEENERAIRDEAQYRIDIAQKYLAGEHPTGIKGVYNNNQTASISDNEVEYIEELKACLEDGIITDREKRLLDRLRRSLGISEARAAELEVMCSPRTFSAEEQEYADEVKACLEDDGEITAKERRLLDRLAKSLGISSERATQIEQLVN